MEVGAGMSPDLERIQVRDDGGDLVLVGGSRL